MNECLEFLDKTNHDMIMFTRLDEQFCKRKISKNIRTEINIRMKKLQLIIKAISIISDKRH
jgi:hypothetical protein